MKYIELFAGIGGFRSALDKLGYECVFSSEIDKYARQSYKALYGHEPSGDITKIDADDIPDHDMIVGGFPCQAFSIAGVRKGFEDTRGTLFFEIIRIASAKNPKWLMLENVKGLLSHDGGKTFDVMCACLNDIGYAIDFKVLNSKHYGVPQNRERIFIIANRDAAHEDWIVEGTDVVAKAKKRIAKLGIKTFNFDFPKNNTVDKRLRDVLQDNVPEKYYLSQEKTMKLIAQLKENEVSVPDAEIDIVGRVELNGHDLLKRVYNLEGLAPTIETMGGGNREPKIAEVYATLTPDREEKRQNGRRFKENDEVSFTLNTLDKHGVTIKNEGYRIRKLTPLECWRLQGFTDEQFQKCVDAGVSDSQLYKQAGNAVTVNVIYELGEKVRLWKGGLSYTDLF